MNTQEVFEKMKWDDIYSYWRISTEEHFCIVNQAPSVGKFSVKGNSKNRVYSYLWLKNDQIDDEVSRMISMTEFPVYTQKRGIKDDSIIRATNMMVQAKNDEERAAIWLWIFCTSLENAKLPYPNSLYIDYVGAKAREFLKESYQEWLFGYHHRFPYLFLDASLLSKVEFKRYSVIVDFAIMNAYMLCKEYSIVLFDSEPEKEEPPFSYRVLRKELYG